MAGSLLDFKPLLDTYDPNAGQEDIRQGMREAAHYASKGIEAVGERGRQREKEFQSVFDMDVSKVTDMESKNYLISEYGKLKNDYVNKFEQNKNILGYGKLSPREKIELRGDMDSLKASAETLKLLDKSLVEASDPKNKKWGYEVDHEKAKAYSEAKQTGDTVKMASLLESVGKSETGIPFVKYSGINPDQYIVEQVDSIRKAIDTSKDIVKRQTESGGKVYDTSTTITKFGTPEDARTTTYNVLSKGDVGPVLESNLQKGDSLTQEEKIAALDEYAGETQFPLLKYYTENKADVSPIVEEKIETAKSVRPDRSDKTGKTIRKIELTDTGAEFGTTPVSITKTVKNTEGKETIIKGGQVVSIKKKDGKWSAQVIVPTAFEEEHAAFMDSISSINKSFEDGSISEQERDSLNLKAFNEFKSKGKWKQEDIPLKDIKKELKTGFDVKKLNVEGFNDITDDETIKYSKAEEGGISSFMKANNLSREEAVRILKENNRL